MTPTTSVVPRLASVGLVLALAACGGASKPHVETVSTTSAALTAQGEQAPAGKTSAEQWAEAKIAKENVAPKRAADGLDPLSEGAALEAAAIPKIERTDKKQLRAKSRGDLDAALSVMKSASTVDEAVTKLTARLGKTTWVENGTKRVWVAPEGARCHRLVLEGDGSVHVETVAKSDAIRLTTTVKQDPCTGEIERGGTN